MSTTLGLRLTRFIPSQIRCIGKSLPVAADCDEILDKIPADLDIYTFGEAKQPGVDVSLPIEFYTTRKFRRSP